MTIQELLDKIYEEKPHSFPESKIISFVNELEPEVAEQMKTEEVPVYSDDAESKAKELLVPTPYDRLYVSFVKAQIDFANEEYASYQLNQEQHSQDFQDFVDWVVRTGRAYEKHKMRFKNTF
jgi:hypothetical protein